MKKFHQRILHIVLILFKRATYCGEDVLGNRYYEVSSKNGRKVERFVLYGKFQDPSSVAPDWFNWLHYSTNTYPKKKSFSGFFWQKKPLPNLTGTLFAYSPKPKIQSETGKLHYLPWKPN